MNVLVINAGSSSLKYQLVNVEQQELLAKGICERVGSAEAFHKHGLDKNEEVIDAKMADHDDAMALVLESLTSGPTKAIDSLEEIDAVGHRIVQGGKYFDRSVLIDDDVIQKIDELAELAPLHNKAALMGINACLKHMPSTPMVAVFDTSFFQTLPPKAYMYPLPYELYEKYAIRKYGAHGTSHRYVSQRALALLGLPEQESGLVIAHLGNGASICAVRNGRSVDTSMGMTPLEGLMMGTRSGDVDFGAMAWIAGETRQTLSDLERVANTASGLLGISGLSSDLRVLEQAWHEGHARARLAIKTFVHRIARHIAGHAAALQRLDGIIFTGGIGENSVLIRRLVSERLTVFGLAMDAARNQQPNSAGERLISADGSRVRCAVIPTNEERMIALDAIRLGRIHTAAALA